MQTISWSPELHRVVRSLKKNNFSSIVSTFKEQSDFSLSTEEEQTTINVFTKSAAHQRKLLMMWDG